MIQVLLVDDQSLLRMGFRLILEAEPDIEVVGEAGDGAAGVSMTSALRPDVVLMDVRMPGMDGIAATALITAACPATKVLILTTFDLDEYVFAGLKAGASGFLLKDAPPAELLTAIRTVAGGDAVLAPTTTRRLIDKFVPLIPDPGRQHGPGCSCSASSPTGNRPSSFSSPPGGPTVRSPTTCTCPKEPSRSTSDGY